MLWIMSCIMICIILCIMLCIILHIMLYIMLFVKLCIMLPFTLHGYSTTGGVSRCCRIFIRPFERSFIEKKRKKKVFVQGLPHSGTPVVLTCILGNKQMILFWRAGNKGRTRYTGGLRVHYVECFTTCGAPGVWGSICSLHLWEFLNLVEFLHSSLMSFCPASNLKSLTLYLNSWVSMSLHLDNFENYFKNKGLSVK